MQIHGSRLVPLVLISFLDACLDTHMIRSYWSLPTTPLVCFDMIDISRLSVQII